MKDEIKEINIPNNILATLGDLANGALNYYKAPKTIELKYKLLLDYITKLQWKYDKALEDSDKQTNKLMAIRKYLKANEREYGSLEDNEKIILGIIEGK